MKSSFLEDAAYSSVEELHESLFPWGSKIGTGYSAEWGTGLMADGRFG